MIRLEWLGPALGVPFPFAFGILLGHVAPRIHILVTPFASPFVVCTVYSFIGSFIDPPPTAPTVMQRLFGGYLIFPYIAGAGLAPSVAGALLSRWLAPRPAIPENLGLD